jgi:predicted HicB family RNase H-like nuclease
MNYKGYVGVLRVDEEAGVLRGKVINTRDTITFQGETVEEATAAFRDSVDDYLDFCASDGVQPEKPFSGKFIVRVGPELHRELNAIAQAKGTSINSLVKRQLTRLAKRATSILPPAAKGEGGWAVKGDSEQTIDPTQAEAMKAASDPEHATARTKKAKTPPR